MKIFEEYFQKAMETGIYPTRYQVFEKKGIKYFISDEGTQKKLAVDMARKSLRARIDVQLQADEFVRL